MKLENHIVTRLLTDANFWADQRVLQTNAYNNKVTLWQIPE